jgi:molybdenum cofactor cytidylyltransferase
METAVAAILLAAGSSTRMGQSKPLLPLDGKPFICHCIDALASSDIKDIAVVLGKNSEIMEKALTGYQARVLINSDAASDMAQSVRVGLSGLCASGMPFSGILISLSDHPMVHSETLKTLITIHSKKPEAILIPAFKGKRGHPTLFPMTILSEILTSGTLRDVVNRDPGRVRTLEVMDEGVIMDIDTIDDYEMAVKKLMNRH